MHKAAGEMSRNGLTFTDMSYGESDGPGLPLGGGKTTPPNWKD